MKQAPLPEGQWVPCPVYQKLHDKGRRGIRETCGRKCSAKVIAAMNTGKCAPRNYHRPTCGKRGTNMRAEWA